MKKIFYLFFCLTLFLIISGCKKDENNPVASSTKGTISGVVTDQTSGSAIVGATITTQPVTSTVQTDVNGKYTISNVEAGIYIITATKADYFQNNTSATVTANQTCVGNITITNSDPIASFTFSGILKTHGSVNFASHSKNADSYLWDFGDGTSSSLENPSKTYNAMGSYSVTLKASNNSSGKSHQVTQTVFIVPEKVFLQKVTIDQFPFTNSSGVSWDLTSGPDLYYTLIDSANTVMFTAPTFYQDLTPSSLPVSWSLSPEAQFNFWNRTYAIDLWDDDTINDEEIGQTLGFKINTFVAANYPTSVSIQNTSGTIKVKLTLRWE